MLSKEPNNEIVNALVTIAPSLRPKLGGDAASRLDELVGCVRDERNLNALKQEFRELFVSSYSGRYIPPFESAFLATIETGRQSRPSEAACAEVEASYIRCGFMPAKLKMDLRVKAFGWSDHVAIELAFLSFLLKTAEGREEPERVEFTRLFMRKHVDRWIETFSDILLQQSNTAYFKFVAELLHEIARLNKQLTVTTHASSR